MPSRTSAGASGLCRGEAAVDGQPEEQRRGNVCLNPEPERSLQGDDQVGGRERRLEELKKVPTECVSSK